MGGKHRSHRPGSVTIISYLLLIVAAIGVLMVIDVLLGDGESRKDSMFMTCAVVSPVLFSTCGFFLLRGANWARMAYCVIAMPVVGVLLILTTGPAAIPRLVF